MSIKSCLMSDQKFEILSHEKIEQKTIRIAYEIVENNFQEDELILIGIRENGYQWAQQLGDIIKEIGEMSIEVGTISMNKDQPVQEEVVLDNELSELSDKVIILIDDVTNTGRTLMYALKPFLQILPRKLLTAVLVDRQHKSFPVSPDYVGLSLATTMQEHITVELGEEPAAYLV